MKAPLSILPNCRTWNPKNKQDTKSVKEWNTNSAARLHRSHAITKLSQQASMTPFLFVQWRKAKVSSKLSQQATMTPFLFVQWRKAKVSSKLCTMKESKGQQQTNTNTQLSKQFTLNHQKGKGHSHSHPYKDFWTSKKNANFRVMAYALGLLQHSLLINEGCIKQWRPDIKVN